MTIMKSLMSGTAALALVASPIVAQTSMETESDTTIEAPAMGAEADAGTEMEMDNDNSVADAMNETGEAIEDGYDATVEAVDDATDSVANEADEMMTAENEEPGMSPTVTVETLVGSNVTVDSGDSIGSVDNVVLVNGEEMAVIGIGGFLGLGEHDVALPLERFTWVGEDLNAEGYSREQLEAMAEFDPETGTELSDEEPVMVGS